MFAGFVLYVLTAVALLALHVSAGPTCSDTDFKACMDEFKVLANNRDLGFAVTEEELTKLCRHLNEAMQCVENYTNRCYDERQRSVYRLAITGTEQLISDLCTRGSDFRAQYLKHASCYRSESSRYKACADTYLHEQESIRNSGIDGTDSLKKSCCLLDGYKECTRGAVLSKCGAEAADLGVQFVTKAGGPLVENLCVSLKRDSSDCNFPSSGLSSTSFSSLRNLYLSLLIVLTALYYIR